MESQPFMVLLLKALAVLGLVLMNAFFVATELALVRVRETQLDALIARGNRRARQARDLVGRMDTVISATQLGITLASLGLGVLVEPVFKALLAPVFHLLAITSEPIQHTTAILIGFLINTYLLIVVGELAPKAFTIRRTVPVAIWTATPLAWFLRIAHPFIWLLQRSAEWLLARLGVGGAKGDEPAHTDEELRLLLNVSQQRRGATQLGRRIVLSAVDLRHRIVREVMRPRREITVFDTSASLADGVALAEQSRYSRFPLCEDGDLDRTLGVIHIKDLYALRDKVSRCADLVPVARKIIYVPETARLEQLLQLFLERKLHLAIVVDEYGGTVGMATLENVLEELVGQIQDEFDVEKAQFVQTGEGEWELSGTVSLHQLDGIVDFPLAEEGVSTISGLVTRRLGGFPKVGDTLTLGRCEVRVEEMDGLLVSKLRLKRAAASSSGVPAAG